ncbi:2-phospho-L-lactate guanylyltransferase [Actinocorallia sp. A-T 12471]|uniref:2-phospho-L-lactate guanylyltransferase n=1 Tax=Actinocorallia sp. A-T 12471 TaxID=3089813 RepID=UPI0029D33DC6|nr:2-phospho-L-lactate guanylyltransferase [Actinocorallia sp. A-T 12471]MDX6739078.1 2-phospho-L-lactate guanylyltransferase [Actinocorallia sp. A-T 12471]
MSNTVAAAWALIVPVKPPTLGKSRLADDAGAHRAALALAVALDTVEAALRCEAVSQVLVVTADPSAADGFTALGARVLREGSPQGLNSALRQGAEAVGSATARAALQADLPALRPAELSYALSAASAFPHAFLADSAGTGTVLYTALPGEPFSPAFGGASRARHLATGAAELPLADLDSVRTDVDTLDDLRAALALGAGPRTRRVASRILPAPSADRLP